jgi:AraC-like DNA-binding protein
MSIRVTNEGELPCDAAFCRDSQQRLMRCELLRNRIEIRKQSFASPPYLSGLVDRFWQWESNREEALPTIFPGTGAEIVFHLAEPPSYAQKGGTIAKLPLVHTISMRSVSTRLIANYPIAFMSIRLRNGVLETLFPQGAEDYQDRCIDASEIFGPVVMHTLDKIRSINKSTERVAILADFSSAILNNRRVFDKRVQLAADRLYYDLTSGIENLAFEIGWSKRQLERNFQSHLGMSPKKYQRVARLYRAIRSLLLAKNRDYLPLVLAQGYYDQSHFIHELTNLTGLVPSELLTEKYFASHFYNPSSSNRSK